jgi:iron complex transport system substrate-binding protein
MKFYRLLLLCAAAFALVLAACGDDDGDSGSPTATTTGAGGTATATSAAVSPTPVGPFFDCEATHASTEPDASYFPVTVTDGNGDEVTITEPPAKIASLDAAHTEILYAIGAGDQVSAVDNTSNCPAQAGALAARFDAFNPSLEAITGLDPDLVITAFDTGDIVASMRAAGLTVLYLPTPADIEGAYDDMKLVGNATGHIDQAEALVTSMISQVKAITGPDQGADAPTVYHEVDNTYYSVGPGSFIADLYNVLGAENIADSTGQAYPQLSSEAIIAANPEVIILADEDFGESAETVGARPGWPAIDAVENGRIYGINPDIISRSGPRIVDALRLLEGYLYPDE